jgi:predicted 3-demethylubiquinone-9 3-methyltransferase (glyoxalase superfamily)
LASSRPLAPDAAIYLSVFPEAKKAGERHSSGVGPSPAGKIATITIELMGRQMTFLNGGPAQALTPACSYSVACKDHTAEGQRLRASPLVWGL